MAETILAITIIYAYSAILILFCYHQETESNSRVMEIVVAGQILTGKEVKGSIVQQYLYYTGWEKHIVVTIHIYVARAISEYWVITKTLNFINEKWRMVELDQYSPKTNQPPYRKTVSIPYNMGEKCSCNYSYLFSWSHFLPCCYYKDIEYESDDIGIGVSEPVFTQKNISIGSIGRLYPYSTRWEHNIVAIFHIYGARAVFLLFCDHQDTESESYETEMSISKPIFNNENASKSLWYKGIYTLQDGRKLLWYFFGFMKL